LPNHPAPDHTVRPRRLPHLPRLLGVFALAIILVGAACSANGGGANSVSIVDYAFNPATSTVKAGTTVTWTNTAGQDHTVTAVDGSSTAATSRPGRHSPTPSPPPARSATAARSMRR